MLLLTGYNILERGHIIMANAVIMPKSGISVESCIIGEWKVKVGDAVKMGDILFTYETDKSSFECESTAEGELLEIFFNDGDEVPCLENVCAIPFSSCVRSYKVRHTFF